MKRKSDVFLNIITIACSSIGIIILLSILIFVFSKGIKGMSFKILVDDYYETNYNLESKINLGEIDFKNPNIKGAVFSEKWGVALKDSLNQNKEKLVEIVYIDNLSPFKALVDCQTGQHVNINKGFKISKLIMASESESFIAALGSSGATEMANLLDQSNIIKDSILSIGGGGIRGSIIATFYLIIITLVIAIPIGVFAAIYIHEYAKEGKFLFIIRTMIDMTSGIPSIIFGLVGAFIFIPFMNNTVGSNGGSIMSGALTLSVMLLPIIIKTTEEALIIIPSSLRMASLALGASKSQTVFKVVLPNAISGILTACILCIGRIIGESAALIFAIGAVIKDNVAINDKATSLAVQIWALLSGENPNYDLSCTISIIILIIVFILSFSVKLISKKVNKMEVSR